MSPCRSRDQVRVGSNHRLKQREIVLVETRVTLGLSAAYVKLLFRREFRINTQYEDPVQG